ncbi:hypothetical protein [Bacteroides faecis]|uniref:hypothetical protein n=1 Tax=Bacteroides faecis TaxID=674529 RepID=UPI0012EAC4C1|nr:hypothetical protein [Bacteroides faecis]
MNFGTVKARHWHRQRQTSGKGKRNDKTGNAGDGLPNGANDYTLSPRPDTERSRQGRAGAIEALKQKYSH